MEDFNVKLEKLKNYFENREDVVEPFAALFAGFAEMRNLVAHEYLDLRWKQIQQFIKQAVNIYPRFLARMKEIAKL